MALAEGQPITLNSVLAESFAVHEEFDLDAENQGHFAQALGDDLGGLGSIIEFTNEPASCPGYTAHERR